MIYDLSEIRNEIEARTQETLCKRQENEVTHMVNEFIKDLIAKGVETCIYNYENKQNGGSYPYTRHAIKILSKSKDLQTELGITKQKLLSRVADELIIRGIDVKFEEDDTFLNLIGEVYVLDLMK